MAGPTPLEYETYALAIRDGEVVPFLGAGVSGVPDPAWDPGSGRLPTGDALARHLAARYRYPGSDVELARVAQYVSTMRGDRSLKRTLHEIFDADFGFTPLHTFLAGLPALLSGAMHAERPESFKDYQLIVTTNYDDTLERAFRTVGEPFDLLTYRAANERYVRQSGRFWFWPLGGSPREINDSNAYVEDLSLEARTLILKIHGMVVRESDMREDHESFVITEDHYIDYLSHAGVASLLPVQVMDRLVNGSLLFLGYALKDWNLRVMLQSIWLERHDRVPAWAVQLGTDDLEERFWRARDIEFVDAPLEEFVPALASTLGELLTPSR